MDRARRQMHSNVLGRWWRKVRSAGEEPEIAGLLTYLPLLVSVLVFYSLQLLQGALLPAPAYLLLALVLTLSGVFGLRSHAAAVLVCIVGGEAASYATGLQGPWASLGNGAALLLAATAVPLVAKGRVAVLTAAQAKLTKSRVTTRLQLGERLSRGLTPNPADMPGEALGGAEALVRNVLLLAKKSLKCRTALFGWYDEATDALVPVETLTDVPEMLANGPILLREGRLTPLKSSKEVLSIRYPANTLQQVPIYTKKVPISSVLAVPVMTGGQLAGAFLMDKEGPDPFFLPDNAIAKRLGDMAEDALRTERKLKSAVMVSEHLRHMIEAASQFGTARTFEAVYEIIVRYAVVLSPFSNAILAHRITPSGTEYEVVGVNRKQTTTLLGKRFELKETLCALASRARSALPGNFSFERRMPQPFGPSVGLELEDNEACAVIPLMLREDPIGFILLGDARKKIVKDDMGPVLLFAEYCAVSLLNVEANKELERMAISDPLTGIPNHRAFSSRIVEGSQRAERSKKPMSMLFLDIDHFKSINDQYGHAVGDTVLRGVSSCLKSSMRKVDFAARYGGEEFVALLEETDSAGAMIFAERLRQRIAEMVFDDLPKGRFVTVSIGIATYPKDTQTVEELIALADSALYKAKNEGRNQCQAV